MKKIEFKWIFCVVWHRKSSKTQQVVCDCLNRLIGKITTYNDIIGECNEIGVYLKYDNKSGKFQVKSFKDIFKI